jgi:AcrR family transcriptional regulator
MIRRANGRMEAAGPLDLHRFKALIGLPPLARLIVDTLITRSDNRTRRVTATAAELAELAGISRRSFFCHLGHLEDLGIVVVHRQFWQPNTYEIIPAALDRLARAVADSGRQAWGNLAARVQGLLDLARRAAEEVLGRSESSEDEAARVAREVLGAELADALGCSVARLRRQWRQDRRPIHEWRAGWEAIRETLSARRGADLDQLWSRTRWGWHVARAKALRGAAAADRQGVLRYEGPQPIDGAAHRAMLAELAELMGDDGPLRRWDADNPGP